MRDSTTDVLCAPVCTLLLAVPCCAVAVVSQSLEREIADFGKDRDKRVKAAQAKLKAAKQVRVCVWCSTQQSKAGRSAGYGGLPHSLARLCAIGSGSRLATDGPVVVVVSAIVGTVPSDKELLEPRVPCAATLCVCVCLQALEAARKQLQKREAELAEAAAECEAAAGEREQVKEQLAASEATIQGEGAAAGTVHPRGGGGQEGRRAGQGRRVGGRSLPRRGQP